MVLKDAGSAKDVKNKSATSVNSKKKKHSKRSHQEVEGGDLNPVVEPKVKCSKIQPEAEENVAEKIVSKEVAERPQIKRKSKKKSRKIVLPDPEPGALEAMLHNKKKKGEDQVKVEEEEETTEATKERKTPKKSKKVKGLDLVKKNFPEKEDEEDSTNHEGHVALDYLKLWKNDRSNWSFKKVRQHWLIRNMYDKTLIDDEHFEILLEYLEGAKGLVVTKTIEEAEKFLNDEISKKKTTKSKRMKKVVQTLNCSCLICAN